MSATSLADDTRHLALDGALSIYTAADTKPQLNTALQGAIALQIDLSQAHAQRMDISLRFIGASAPIVELLHLSGLAGQLSIEEACA